MSTLFCILRGMGRIKATNVLTNLTKLIRSQFVNDLGIVLRIKSQQYIHEEADRPLILFSVLEYKPKGEEPEITISNYNRAWGLRGPRAAWDLPIFSKISCVLYVRIYTNRVSVGIYRDEFVVPTSVEEDTKSVVWEYADPGFPEVVTAWVKEKLTDERH